MSKSVQRSEVKLKASDLLVVFMPVSVGLLSYCFVFRNVCPIKFHESVLSLKGRIKLEKLPNNICSP
jgi:hypothetical protein